MRETGVRFDLRFPIFIAFLGNNDRGFVNIDEIVFDMNDERFTRTTIKVDADKTAIKKALKDGINVVGASLEQKMNLQVK